MTTYDNTNRGVLFDNDRKESDSHPDMKGKLNVHGVDYWFAGWWKNSDSKGEFLSLSLGKPCEQQQQSPVPHQEQPQRRGNRPSQQAPAPAYQTQQRRPPAAAPRAPNPYDDDPDIPF